MSAIDASRYRFGYADGQEDARNGTYDSELADEANSKAETGNEAYAVGYKAGYAHTTIYMKGQQYWESQ